MGAHRPYQLTNTKPGKPLSEAVGISGAMALRRAEVVTTGCTLPVLAIGIKEMMESSKICACPPATSTNAGEVPLYGAMVSLRLDFCANSRVAKWLGAPMAGKAAVHLSGC